MCKTCRTLHMREYERLRDRIERKRNVMELFEFHKCCICRERIEWGTDVCVECRRKRDVIRDQLIKEFKQSVLTQKDENGKI